MFKVKDKDISTVPIVRKAPNDGSCSGGFSYPVVSSKLESLFLENQS